MTYDTINDARTIAGNGEGTLLAGRYRIVRQLGSGGMGSVWLAEDTQLDNKQFAIKMLPSILVSNKRAYRQLKDEALVAMKLTHPNIVTLRAFEENNGNPFLVMDYIDGQTLDDYLCERGTGNGERGNGLSEEETIRILRPIAAALDYAHGEGVVHRDVKPANVMIRKDGHPFILDFGIAREIQETMTRVTGKLSSGTLLYMSPEQLMGEKPALAQDIYSFAAMVYECLKGEPPFSHGQIEFQIMNKMPEMLVGASGPLTRSVMAGLAKKPEGRPVTCAAVLRVDDSSRVEHVERADGRARSPSGPQSGIPRPMVVRDAPIVSPSVGARVPQDRPAERSSSATEGIVVPVNTPHQDGALKALAVAAGIAFVVVGGWWYANQKHEDARMAEQRSEEARRKARVDAEGLQRKEAERRAEAERKKEAERLAKEKAEAERKAAEERVRQAAETAARVAATEIRIEANVQKAKVERISDADGFKAKKDTLAGSFARADALFDEKVKRWSESAVLFTNYVNECKALAVLDGERQTAVAKRTEAQAAFRRAEDAGAKTYAKDSWNAAVKTWNVAASEFGNMEFVAAAETFTKTIQEFEACEFEACMVKAKAEQKRQKGKSVEPKEITSTSYMQAGFDKWYSQGYLKNERVKVIAMDNSIFYDHNNMFNKQKAFDAYKSMCSNLGYPFETEVEEAKKRPPGFGFWSVDYNKRSFTDCGLGGIIRENDIEKDISEIEYFLLPGQSQTEYRMVPTHVKIKHQKTGQIIEKDLPAKKSRWLVKHGWVYYFSSVGTANLDSYPEIKASISSVFRSSLKSVHVERWDADGRIHEVEGDSNWHFLMGGDEGAVVIEYGNYNDSSGMRFSVSGVGF